MANIPSAPSSSTNTPQGRRHDVFISGTRPDPRLVKEVVREIVRILQGTSSAPSSSTNTLEGRQRDVFISFRGEDSWEGFTNYLYEALRRNHVDSFMDDQPVTGDEILPAHVQAIEESKILVVVLSKNYASSKRCLDELVKILECMKNNRQIVFPIFYEVHPSDVRNKKGSFEKSFVEYEKQFSQTRSIFGNALIEHEIPVREMSEKVQRWRDALTQASNLSGIFRDVGLGRPRPDTSNGDDDDLDSDGDGDNNGNGGGNNSKEDGSSGGDGNGNGNGGDKSEGGGGSGKMKGKLDFKGEPGFDYRYGWHGGSEHEKYIQVAQMLTFANVNMSSLHAAPEGECKKSYYEDDNHSNSITCV